VDSVSRHLNPRAYNAENGSTRCTPARKAEKVFPLGSTAAFGWTFLANDRNREESQMTGVGRKGELPTHAESKSSVCFNLQYGYSSHGGHLSNQNVAPAT